MDGYRLELSSLPNWLPLERLQELCERRPDLAVIDLAEFMYCGQLVGPAVPAIVLYKHRQTRAYLCLDACGHTYVVSSARNALHTRIERLTDAVRRF